MKRYEFSSAVKLSIIARATDANGVAHCEKCGNVVTQATSQIDHVISEAVAARKRFLRPSDGQLLCLDCHAAKSAIDAEVLAKARRLAEDQPRLTGQSEIARRFGLAQEDPPDD